MKSGDRFVGFDPATGDDWSAYVEVIKLPDNTFKLERILHVPPGQADLLDDSAAAPGDAM